jgi:hypothetical protein
MALCPKRWGTCRKNPQSKYLAKAYGPHVCDENKGHKGRHKCGLCGGETS